MNEVNIYTEKEFLSNVSYDLMHEWEYDFAKYINVDLVSIYRGRIGRIKRNAFIFFNKIRRVIKVDNASFKTNNSRNWHIIFIPNALVYLNYTHLINLIPIFVDFPESMVVKIASATEKLPIYFVTAYDIYEKLKKCGSKNVEYIPMGISDYYVRSQAPRKTIDVVQFGRRNEKLHKWMLNYCERNPKVEYVFVKNANFEYYSTTRGDIGRYETRTDFCDLIDKTKIALVSSPGAEKESRFGNIDFITPRFYECAAHYCFMIGRYTVNMETEIIGLDEVCPSVDTQTDFECYLDNYIKGDVNDNINRYRFFLDNNVISKRAERVKTIIDRYI